MKFKKIQLTKEQKQNLPIFYEFVICNEMLDAKPGFSDDYLFFEVEGKTGNVIYSPCEKPISKIIDFSRINEELFKPPK